MDKLQNVLNGLGDVLNGRTTHKDIGEFGVVGLVDVMPRLVRPGETLDHAVVQAARTSYGQQNEEKSDAENRGLIRYLFRKNHVTPFEMVNVKWFHRLPVFVARQLIRHRTASVNEFSMRYKEPKDEFFIPDAEEVRKQSKVNKQGSEGQIENEAARAFILSTDEAATDGMRRYKDAVVAGIGREQARINLPLSIFTEWFWEIDLNNLLRMLALRMDKHAQKEIRDYADAMYEMVAPLAPWTFEAFNDFSEYRDAVKFSRLEMEALWTTISILKSRAGVLDDNSNGPVPVILEGSATKGEQDEWNEKRLKLIKGFEWKGEKK